MQPYPECSAIRTSSREHVLQVIKELNYQPNVLARQLRVQETKTIIVIVPIIENSFLRGIISRIAI